MRVCVSVFQEYICIYFSSNICIRIWMHFNFVSLEFLQIFFISFFLCLFVYRNLQVLHLVSYRMRPKVTYLDWVNFAEDGLIPISGAILMNTTLGCWPAEHFHALSTQLLFHCFFFLYWGLTYLCFHYCWVLGEFTKWNVLYKLHAYYYVALNTYIYNIYI